MITKKLPTNCRIILLGLTLSLSVFSCTNNSEPDTSLPTESSAKNGVLTLWWDKGFTLEEDEAIQQVVKQWQQETGNKAELSLFSADELSKKTQRAIRSGNPPDIVMSNNADRILNPSLAREGKLADVSEVVQSVKPFYSDTVLKSAYFYNKLTKKQSYYAVPLHQSIPYIFYWRDLLQEAGKSEKDIPKDWNGFWEFWKQIQDTLQTKNNQKIYGLGLPLSVGAGDTFEVFEQILEAHDVQIVDERGRLRTSDPKVRQGLIHCIAWYTKFYEQGYVPKDAVNWFNPDNNRSLFNRHVVMTANNSLSIPAAVRRNSDVYFNKLGTIGYPNKPNGKPMRYVSLITQAIILTESKNQRLAKDFLIYFISPEIMGNYLKAAGGRFFPVHDLVWKDPFWTNKKDPHISEGAKPLIMKQTRLLYIAQNSSYSKVLMKNVWGQALRRVVINRVSPEEAADKAIQQINEIFAEYSNPI
ncbi:ABC transporter substrate-binding protein [Scytonema hofmannii PCC 7110]|uniref:ABC transporter substrate-binding protein n=1 Tax=Scytonema hofmannii PCC 7110 TaxID=128403 RepID=A0A139XEU1_9CYAN|nr:ABC transporter substrate-binding protein [Scytonema hofmannii]KYC43210.1 ABC transporter substrate-binding protein [Scytonema hofmannii PCC 7110]